MPTENDSTHPSDMATPAARKPLWEGKRRVHAERCVARLYALAKYNEEKNEIGWPVFDSPASEYDARALSASMKEGYQLPWSVRCEVFRRMKAEGTRNLDDFERFYWEVLAEQAESAGRSTAEWTLYLPFEVELSDEIREPALVELLGTTFTFLDREQVKATIGAEKVHDALSQHRLYWQDTQFFDRETVFVSWSCSRAVSVVDAWEKKTPVFDAFRGLWEFTHRAGRIRISSDPSARRTIPAARWAIGASDAGTTDVLEFISEDLATRPQLPSIDGDKALKVDKRFFDVLQHNATLLPGRANDKSTVTLIANALRLYAQAMDAPFDYGCFLALWQLIEAVALDHAFRVVCPRIRKLLRPVEQAMAYGDLTEVLREFANKRNDLVHRGIHFDIGQEDVNLLKPLCETAIFWLINHLSVLPTIHHLEHYYEWSTKGDGEIEAMEATLGYLKEQRDGANGDQKRSKGAENGD